ncbi:phage tail assembly chaperone [Acetoanaerobium noterae]|uniref:phage tail assembly chaperone n=1 Tax=Acetoanaerobium noterae TaxID=745369 RepID=UPI00333E3837
MSFEAFMKQNALQKENEEIVISDRFKNPDGSNAKWIIRPLGSEEHSKLRSECLSIEGKGRKTIQKFDQQKYMCKLAVSGVVEPDLHNKELQDSYGVMGAESLINKMLYAGELDKLVEGIQEISGIGKDFNELVDEAKN